MEVREVGVGARAGRGVTTRTVHAARLRSSVDALGPTIERAPENIDTDAPDPEVPAARLRTRARLRVEAPAADVLARVHHGVGVVEPRGSDACVPFTGADSPDTVAASVGMLRIDLTVEPPREPVPLLGAVADRKGRAVAGWGADAGPSGPA